MMRPLLVSAALVAPALASAGWGEARAALVLEGAFSRSPEAPRLAAGGRLSARLSFAEAALALDWALRDPPGEAGYRSTALVGAGPAHDVSPLASLHLHALAGTYSVRLRDYVYGGWRAVNDAAWGGELGVRLHPPAVLGRSAPRIWPLAGLWVTVLHAGRRSDRLRTAEWGGTLVVVTVTLGAELTGPARHALPPG